MSTTTATLTVEAATAKIQQQLSEMLDPLDIPRTWTQRQLEAYETQRGNLGVILRELGTNHATLVQVTPKIEADEKWEADLLAMRTTLLQELATLPPQIRLEKDLHFMTNRKISVRIVDFGPHADGQWTRDISTLRLGELLLAAGYRQFEPERNTNATVGEIEFHGCLAEVQPRLKDLRARRDDAQKRLNDALLAAEAL